MFTELIEREVLRFESTDKILPEKQVEEAKNAGLTLLRSAEKSYGKCYANYKLYRFNACGHEQFLQPTHVRRNHITCLTCYEDGLRIDLSRFGYSLVKHIKGSRYLTRVDECGHEFDMNLATIRTRTTNRCSICYEKRIAEECKPKGLEIVGKTTRAGQYRKYKFIGCGHTIDTVPEVIRDDRFECKVCIEDEFVSKTSPQGLTLLDRITTKGYRWFILPCGCEREIRLDHARDGAWLCSNCDKTHYNKSSNLYLVKFESEEFSWLKFGFSKNMDFRFDSYGVQGDFKRALLYTVPVENGYLALELEKGIHAELKEHRLDKRLMKNYHTSSGYTECYPVALEEVLINKMQRC